MNANVLRRIRPRLLTHAALLGGTLALMPEAALAQTVSAPVEPTGEQSVGGTVGGDRHRKAGANVGASVTQRAGASVTGHDTPGPATDIVVTGARDTGYAVQAVNSGTKITADILDLPLSVTAVDRALIDDINAVRTAEIVQYVSGVFAGSQIQADGDNLIMRGFQASDFLRDGYPDRNRTMRDSASIERLEVLKGPASVLYGRIEPGGTVNYVTKRALDGSDAAVGGRIDSFGLARVTGDVSLANRGETLGLRLNVAGETGGTFRDFTFSDRVFGAAAGAWKPAPDTQVSIDFDYLYDRRSVDRTGIPILNGKPAPIPIARLVTEPDDFRTVRQLTTGYMVQHAFGEAWTLRHALRYNWSEGNSERTQTRTASLSPTNVTAVDPLTGEIDRNFRSDETEYSEVVTQLELAGRFATGASIDHNLLVGVERDGSDSDVEEMASQANLSINRINIFNPVYGRLQRIGLRRSSSSYATVRSWAMYAQDLITLGPRWNALIGVRYDINESISDNRLNGSTSASDAKATSPRVGLVWHPSERSSLYASYSQSFVPVLGQDFRGNLFAPTRGKQIEVGAKARWLDGRLTASTAAFRIQRSNVPVNDPENDGFRIQTGLIESKGVEFDINAAPLPGLNIVASASYIEAEIVRDTRPAVVGTRPNNVPKTGAALWVSYEARSGRFTGLGGGLGAVHVGNRFSSNSGRDFFTVPRYERLDANLWYDHNDWRVSLKIENVFDTRYVASPSNLAVRPGAPLNAVISLGRTFR